MTAKLNGWYLVAIECDNGLITEEVVYIKNLTAYEAVGHKAAFSAITITPLPKFFIKP